MTLFISFVPPYNADKSLLNETVKKSKWNGNLFLRVFLTLTEAIDRTEMQ